MRVQRFEAYLKELLTAQNHDEITDVRTFAEADYTDKPNGLVIDFASGARVFIQFVRTSPPGGENFRAEEKITRKRGARSE